MSTNPNIFKNVISSVFSKFSQTILRVIQIPLLIYFLGVDDFGRWTVLYTIPSWLTLANFGFGTVASNQITMLVADNKLTEAIKTYASTFFLLLIIFIVGSLLTTLIIPVVNWDLLLKTNNIASRNTEFSHAVIFMSISVFLSFFYGLLGSAFRAKRKMHRQIYISTLLPWLNLGAMIISLSITKRFDYLSFALLFSNIIYAIIFYSLSKKTFPSLVLSGKYIDTNLFKLLFKKGIAFQAMPLGNALNIQGSIIIIQFILGPAAVALFSTLRTLINIIKQVIDIINQSTWSELSYLIGEKNYIKASKIHAFGISVAIIMAILGCIFLLFFGEFIYNIWTDNQITLPFMLLLTMLASIPLNALWVTSSVVLMASNNHEKLAKTYILVSLITFALTLILTYFYHLNGAAFSMIIFELLLVPFVVKNSIIITNDNWINFKKEVIKSFKVIPVFIFAKLKLR
ncbi:lipopolysaccharide biosynthesis protein [Lacinutrix sp. MEBiC02595]